MKIEYIHEPTDLQCGQAVLAMVLGIPVGQVSLELGNERETTLKEMRSYFEAHGVKMAAGRSQAQGKEDVPRLALLSLETPRCWHWSLYADGVFYDPEHGVLDDFPECNRKYFWGLFNTIHSDDDWCTPGMREAPFYYEGITPEQYELERTYLAEHFKDLQNGTYVPLYKQNKD